MIIVCINCNKKFETDQNLIPTEGRMLQCGSCNHKWFFKIENNFNENEKNINDQKIDKKNEESDPIIKNFVDETLHHEDPPALEKSKAIKSAKKNEINYFKVFIVIIISIAALIILLETFKVQLKFVIPNIETLLDNLYQSIKDIKLFMIDLTK